MRPLEPEDIAIVAITRSGVLLGSRLASQMGGGHLFASSKLAAYAGDREVGWFQGPVAKLLEDIFPKYRKLVLFSALGAAVRLLAPLLEHKKTDPAVVVVDDSGKYAISALSGHVGGANDLARQVAGILGAEPVITTGSDVLGTLAPDMIGRDLGWVIESETNLTKAGSAIVNGEPVGLYQDAGERDWWKKPLPANVRPFDSLEALSCAGCEAALIVTDRTLGPEHAGLLNNSVVYRPKSLVVGLGCNRGVSQSEVEEAVLEVLSRNSLSLKSVRNLSTIDIKSDENGILDFAHVFGLPITYYSSSELEGVAGIPNPSETIRRLVGTRGVCEPAALLSAGTYRLLVEKTRMGNMTVAVARIEIELSEVDNMQRPVGTVFVVGLGPGARGQMTLRAREALLASDAIVGYKTYLELIGDLLAGKQVVSSGMRQEVPRARTAIELAEAGKNVSIVSSGDAGVYGMAGLVYDVARARGWPKMGSIEVVPGVSALNAAAALLGAPLMHDFAAISLSDLLTPWETILRRLRAAAEGDFVLALYNPRSGRRTRQIEEARRILLEHRSRTTPVGLVTNAYREGQEVVITDLEHMLDHSMNMLTTVIVGNSQTASFDGVIVTPRGYEEKYELGD